MKRARLMSRWLKLPEGSETNQHCKRNNTRRREKLRSCRAVCRLCRAVCFSGGHTDVEHAPSCRLFDTSMGHNHEEAQSRVTSSSAASSNARCSGKRAAAFASFEDSLQKTRHRACCEAARCCFLRGIIPAAGEIEGPTQKTRRSHPCLVSRRGTWGFGSL